MKCSMPVAAAAALCLGGITILAAAAGSPDAVLVDPQTAASQWTEYQADAPKTIVELQAVPKHGERLNFNCPAIEAWRP